MIEAFHFWCKQFRHLPTLRRHDRYARKLGVSKANRWCDWWGNLAALEAAREGRWV